MEKFCNRTEPNCNDFVFEDVLNKANTKGLHRCAAQRINSARDLTVTKILKKCFSCK